VANGTISLAPGGMSIAGGRQLDLTTKDGYQVQLNGAVNGAGATINVTAGSNVAVNAAITADRVTDYGSLHLNVANGINNVGMTTVSNAGALNLGVSPAAGTNVTLNDGGSLRATNAGVTFGPNTTLTITGAGGVLGGGTQNYAVSSPVNMPTPTVLRKTGSETVTLNGLPNTLDGVTGTVKVDNGGLDVRSVVQYAAFLNVTGGAVEVNADFLLDPNSSMMNNNLNYGRFEANGTGWSGGNYALNGNYSPAPGDVFTGTTAGTPMQYIAANPNSWLKGQQTGQMLFANASRINDRPYGLQPNPWPGKGVYEPNSNFGYLWTGYLNVPAGKGGQWGLNPDWIDGVDNIAIDLNGDGDFTDAGEALGNNQTIYAQLQAGRTYPVAFSFYGGGNNCTAFRYQQPNDGNWYLINPSDAAQAGLWSSSLTTGIAISGGAINVNPGHRLAGQSVQISGGTLTVSGSGAGGTLETNALVVSGGGALNIGATVGGDPGKLVIHGNLIEQYGAATGNFINLNGTFLPDGPGTIKIRGGTAWAPLLATFNAGIVPGDATNAWAPDLSGFGAKYNANFAGATGYGTSAVANNAILNLTVPGAVRAGGSVNLVADAGAAIPSAGELRISASGAVGPGAVISGSGRWYVNVAVQQTGAGQVPYLDVTDKAAVGGDLTGFTILSVPGSGPQNIFLEDGAIYAGTAGAAPTWATQGASRQLWKGLLASEMNSPGAVLTVGTNGAGTGVYGKGVALGNWTYPDGVQTAAFTGTIQQVPGAVDGSVKVLLNNGFALTLNSATLNLNTGSIASGNKYQFDEVGNLTLVSALGAASTAKRFDVNGLPNRQNANVLTLQSGAALINNNQLWTVTNGRIYTAGSSADGLVANQSILNVSQSATLHMDRWLNSGYINIAAGGALRVQDTNCLNNIGQVTAVGSPNLTPLSVPSSTINIDTNAPAGNYPLMLVTAEMGGGNAPIAVAMKNMNIVMARTDADWHSFRWNSSLNLGNNRYLMSPQGLYQYLPGWWDGGTTNQIYAAAAGTAGNMVNIGIAKFGPDSEPTRFQLQDGRVINYDGKAYVNTTFGSHAPLMGIASVNDYTRVYEIPAGAIYLPNAYVNSGGGTGVANVWSGRVRKYNYNAVEAGLTWNVEGTAYNNANYTATLEIDGNSAGVFANQTVNVRNLGTVRGYFWRDWQAQAPSVINNRLTGGTYNFYDGGTLQLLTNYDDWNTQTNQAQITTIAFDDGTVNYNVMPSASVKFTSDVYWNDNDHSIAKIAKVTMKGGSTLTLSTIGNRSWDIPSVDASDGDVTIARTGARGTDFTNGNRAVIGTLKGAAGKTLSLTSDTAVNYPITISAFAGGADAKTWPGTLRFPAGAPNATFPSPTTVVNDVITSGTGAMTINGSFTIGGSLINNGRVISNISATIGPAAGSTVKVAAVSGAGAFVPAANTTLTLDLPITGAGSQLNTAGGGTVQLNVLSSHDGGTSIAGPGTLVSKGANTAGAALGTGPLSIATGGTLRVDPGVGNSQYLGAVTGAANSGTIVGHTGIVDFGAKTITNESAQYHYGMVQEGMLTPSNPPGSGNHPADATNTPPSWLETSSTRGLLGGSFPGATTNLPWPTLGGPDQTTIVYRGQFFWPGSASGNVTLAENCDDWTWLRLDGAVVLNDGAWNTPTAWTGALGKGWHDFEVRVGNGGGGYGASGQNNNGWVNWTGAFGFGFDPTADVNNKDAATFKAFSASTDYQYDDGTGNAAFQLRYMAEGGVIAVDPGAAVKAGAIVNGTVKLNGAGNAATLALNDAAALRPSTVDTLTVLGGAGVISTGTNTSLAVASLTVPAGASLTKMGPGDLSVLNGTISGELNVNGGVFRAPTVAGGGLVSGTINVNAGGIMTGTGAASVVGSDSAPAAVAVNTGGLLSAGNSAAPGDVLTINGAGVTLNGAGGLLAKMGTSQGSDLSDVIAIGASGGVPGTLAFGPGAAPVVIVDDRGVVTDHYYKFLSFSGADPELVNWIVGTSDPNQVNKSWVLDGNGPWGTPNNAEQWSGSASVAGTVVYPTDPDGIPGWLTVHITGSGKLPPGPISNATIVPVAGATRDIVVDGPLTSAGIASLTIGGAHNHLATLALTTGDLAVAGATAVNAGGLLTTGDAALGNTGNFQTSTLSVAGAMSVGAGTTANVAGAATVSGTLNVPGTFNANSLTSSGSVSFLGAGNVAILTVSGGNTALSGSQTVGVANVSGGSLAASAGSIGTLRVTGGSADISGGTVATASISGGAGNKFRGGAVTTATFSGGDTTVSGPAAVTTATVSAGATLGLNNGGGTPVGSLIVNGGNVSVGAAGAIIGRGDFKAAAGTVNAAHPLAVTTGLTFQDSYSASFTGDGVVTSFSATGANLGNNNVDRTLTLSGGSLALAKYSAPVGTVAWYKFDDPGNWGLDSIGGHNMRIVAGSPTAAATAHSGGAIQWANGQSMRIDGADFPSLAGQLPDAQGQTLIMWLKRSAIDINQQGTSGIMAGLGNGSNDHYTWDNGLAYFNTFRNNSRVDNIPVDTSAVQQTWHMIAIVRNPADGTWKFYSNVAEKMSTALAGYQLDNYWEIGRNTNNNYWSGSMDDVMLVNRALSPAELATVYGAAGGAVALPKTHIALAPGAAATLDLGGADLDHSLGNLSLSDGATLTLKEAKTVTFQNVTNATGSGTATVEYFNPATGAVIPLVVKGSLAPAGQMIINTDLHLATGSSASFNLTAKPNETYQQVSLNFNNGLTFQTGVGDLNVRFDAGPDVVGAGAYHLFTGVYPGYMDTGGGANLFRNTTIANATDGAPLGFQWHDFDPVANGIQWINYDDIQGNVDVQLDLANVAQTIATWKNTTGNGRWGTAGNWDSTPPGLVPTGPAAVAKFDRTLGSPNGGTVNVDGPKTVGSLIFNSSNSYTLTGSDLTLDNTGLGSATITVAAGADTISARLVLAGNLTLLPAVGTRLTLGDLDESPVGSGRKLTLNDRGTVVLSGTSTFTGLVTVNKGELEITTGGAWPPGNDLVVGPDADVVLVPDLIFGGASVSAVHRAPSAVTAVPEPGALALVAIGALSALFVLRLRRVR
jgi:autotransporter-associated beta strand protein